jgi:hypothetical protein
MKNLIIPIALGIFLFTSCSKDESFEQTEDQTTHSVYVLKQNNQTTSWETISLENVQENTSSAIPVQVSTSNHTEGQFTSSTRDLFSITWSGTQSNGRTSGSAVIEQTTPSSSFKFIMETECVTVDGDNAVYGGIITEVITRSGDTPQIGINWRFYFKVIDNGRGSSTVFDQISNTRLFTSPRSQSLCNVYLPNDPIWSSQGYENVLQPGYVDVD